MNQTRALTIDDLLKRVDFKASFVDVVESVVKQYPLGSVKTIDPLLVGHEEVNVFLETDDKKSVIKFFNKKKGRQIALGVAEAHARFKSVGIEVPDIVRTISGELICELPSQVGNGFLLISEYFEGEMFSNVTATKEDIAKIVRSMALSHTLEYKPFPEYDFWLPQYLCDEFKFKGKYLNAVDHKQVSAVVDLATSIDFSACRRTIGHYDLHRDNIQKNAKGDICIFDLATVDSNYTIYDLSAFIGFYLESRSSGTPQEFYSHVITEYAKHRKLEESEQGLIFDGMKIIFASNVMAATYLAQAEDDDTEETHKWYRMGKQGLDKYLDVSVGEFLAK